jgi:hypothetical protein
MTLQPLLYTIVLLAHPASPLPKTVRRIAGPRIIAELAAFSTLQRRTLDIAVASAYESITA